MLFEGKGGPLLIHRLWSNFIMKWDLLLPKYLTIKASTNFLHLKKVGVGLGVFLTTYRTMSLAKTNLFCAGFLQEASGLHPILVRPQSNNSFSYWITKVKTHRQNYFLKQGSTLLADPGKAKGCSSDTVIIYCIKECKLTTCPFIHINVERWNPFHQKN